MVRKNLWSLLKHINWVVLSLILIISLSSIGCSESIPEFVNLLQEQPLPDKKDPFSVTIRKSTGQSDSTASPTLSYDVIFSEAIDPTTFVAPDFNKDGTAIFSVTNIQNPSQDKMNFTVTVLSLTTGSVNIFLPLNSLFSADGESENSSSSNLDTLISITGGGIAHPPDPAGLVATVQSPTSIKLIWDSGGGTTIGYKIAYTTGLSAPADCQTDDIITSDAIGDSLSYPVSELTPETEYSFRLCAVNGDDPVESSTGVTITRTTAVLPQVEFASSLSSHNEGDGIIELTVTLSTASTLRVDVLYNFADNNTDAGDWSGVSSGTLIFNSGETSKIISLTLIDDSVPELLEFISATLSAPVNAELGTRETHSINIVENDLPSVEFVASKIREDEGANTATIKFKISEVTDFTTTIDVGVDGVDGGTASAADISSGFFPKVITFDPGELEQSLVIPLTDDTSYKGHVDEFIALRLSAPSLLNIGSQNRMKVHIRDNDYCKGFHTLDSPYANSTANPAGSYSGPILICTKHQLNQIGLNPSHWNKYFKLMADIDMTGISGTAYKVPGTSIDVFSGTLDGNDYTIENFAYNGSANEFGLIGYLTGSLKNLTISNAHVTANAIVGIAVGSNHGTISNVEVTGVSSVKGVSSIGGLVGLSNGIISNSRSSANVRATTQGAGGLIGVAASSSNTFHSYSQGTVKGTSQVGGLIGEAYSSATITGCFSAGDVTADTVETLSVGRLYGLASGGGAAPNTSSNAYLATQSVNNTNNGSFHNFGANSRSFAELSNNLTDPISLWDVAGELFIGREDHWILLPDDSQLPVLNRPSASSGPTMAHFIFATSTIHFADFGGVVGANSICQTAANSSSQSRVKSRSYRAVISDEATAAANQLPITGPIFLPTGLSGGFVTNDLWGGTLNMPIQQDENASAISANWAAWTGSNSDGTIATESTCSSWSSSAGYGVNGFINSVDGTWANSGVASCNIARRLYCLSID
ncbi:Calx-beta domain-containing protein [Bdellovibrionales bacterium]|nr:Calx-beta domain-containing protein [Bdellovibrionales bacterium]